MTEVEESLGNRPEIYITAGSSAPVFLRPYRSQEEARLHKEPCLGKRQRVRFGSVPPRCSEPPRDQP